MSNTESKLKIPRRVRISKNFYLDEFLCKCGQCNWSSPDVPVEDLISLGFIIRLQKIRDDLGFAIEITSGARCKVYNLTVGGASSSGHIVDDEKLCEACDINILNYTPRERYDLLRLAYKHQMRGIGIAETFMHVDRKTRKAIWGY